MKPRTIGSEENLSGTGALDGFYDVIETPHAGGVCIYVGIADQLVDDALLRFPVVRKTSQVRDDEVHIGILRGQHVYDMGLSDHVNQDRESKGFRGIAQLAIRKSIEAVNLNSTKTPARHGVSHHLEDPARVAAGVHEGKADQPVRIA